MNIILELKRLKRLHLWFRRSFVFKQDLGSFGENSRIETPTYIDSPQSVFIEENARIRQNVSIINAPTEKVIIKKYTTIASGVTIITNNHRSTVSIPHFLLGPSHINDKSADVTINEDVWIGANATILAGVTIGRGAIVGAGAIVTRDVPPYTIAIGFPAKIAAKKFSYTDVIRHETQLYPKGERLPEEYLRELLDVRYKDLKIYGCNNSLTQEEKQILENVKKDLAYKEPLL